MKISLAAAKPAWNAMHRPVQIVTRCDAAKALLGRRTGMEGSQGSTPRHRAGDQIQP
jgi:hypothetical protein